MATSLDAQKIEAALRQRLDARMDSVRALVRSRQELDDAKAALKAAEDEDVRRWNAALIAGWTPEELRAAGLTEPEKKARVRKRATRRNTTEQAPSPDAVPVAQPA
ncbi:hypothetical protein [Sinomonas humi]|uniref:hypothetical protein n=1 Tax=Sinomonas humi TaxID=1338436 RepID=UPI000689D8CB|nr:hypothetical protein [Sinomonas humi]